MDGSVSLTQPRMISRVRDIVGQNKGENIKTHDTPATTILTNNADLRSHLQKWNYRSADGCLSYIRTMVRPDITFATQK